MILPVALVDRWPEEHYKEQYATKEEALRANTRDAVLIWHEIELIKDNFKNNNDHRPSKIHDKNLDPYLRTKHEQLSILTKYSDFCALTMASYSGAQLLSKDQFWDKEPTIKSPVLIRGISSAPIGDHMLKRSIDYYFIETGYFGNYPCKNNDGGRKLYHRIVRNGMQHLNVMDVPDDRWQDLVKFNHKLQYQGWKKNPGSKILLVVPSNKPCKYYGIDQDSWINETIEQIKQHTDREIVVRHKDPRWARSQNSIYDALDDDVWATVTYNSIAATESVHCGVPAFALAPNAADPVCSKDLSQLETPYKPNEELVYRWLCSLAYGQFHMYELLNGTAWKIVLDNSFRSIIKTENFAPQVLNKNLDEESDIGRDC